jgi:hypothetical protein
MPTDRNRHAGTVEEFGFSPGVVQQAVMRRIETAGDRKRILYVHGDPVAKHHPFFIKVMPEFYVPSREVPQEEGSSRFEDANALRNPTAAPV